MSSRASDAPDDVVPSPPDLSIGPHQSMCPREVKSHKPLRALAVPGASALWGVHKSFRVQITALTLLGLIVAYSEALFLGTPRPGLTSKYLGLSLLGLFLVASVSLFGFAVALLVSGEERPIPKVWAKACSFVAPPVLIDRVLPILLVFAFLGAFTQMKAMIPTIQPFSWDAWASNLDRLIFGTDPWRLTHEIIGPSATRVIDAIYLFWFPVLTCVIFYHSVFAPEEQKRRFFLSFYGLWIILGLFAATVFSSAGPCFLELIGSPVQERYVGLFPTSLASQRVMNYLAETYTTGRLGIGTGISAMPSLHVGFAFLYMLVATKPIWRIVAFAYSMVIFLGSVHLGWHYAVDGIAAAAGTWLIYWMTSIAKHKRSATVPPIGVADLDNGLKA